MKNLSHIISLAIGSAAVVLASTAPAQALVFNVNGTNYDITTVTDTAADLSAELQATPWYGNSNLISQVVTAVGASFGYPNNYLNVIDVSPYFIITTTPLYGYSWTSTRVGGVSPLSTDVATYAVITPVAAVPFDILGGATIPVLGSVLALGVMRKVRKSTSNNLSITTTEKVN